MEADLYNIITKLNTNVLTHPNIVKLWKCYLYKKVERLNDSKCNLREATYNAAHEYYINSQFDNLNKSISKCNNAIELMTHMNDLTPETLLLLLTLQSNIT
jgi:hypothetical protein